MKRPLHTIAVERGGTWVRAFALDRQRRLLRQQRLPSTSLERFPAQLKDLLARWRARPERLAIVSAGVWKAGPRAALKRTIHPLAERVFVTTDVEAAWHAAFERDPGILLIAGTGSIAYGCNAAGKSARTGGLGPARGDEGSGFWIGRQWRGGAARDVRRIAARAAVVLRQAMRGQPRARAIIDAAAGHLADLVAAVARQLTLGPSFPLALHGSVALHPAMAKRVRQELKQRGLRIRRRRVRGEPALRWARVCCGD